MNTITIDMIYSPIIIGVVALVIIIGTVRALVRLASGFIVG